MKKELMADKAYDELKWKILNGDIGPGEFFTETTISELIGLGRSPVRSALSRLQHDRLIDVIPRKGMLIRGVSNQEIQEVISVRLAIAPLIGSLAAQNATKEDIQILENILAEGENLGLSEFKVAMRIDHEFHVALAKATHNQVLEEVEAFIKKRSSILWSRSIVTEKQIKDVQKEHKRILNAVKKRDGKLAADMLRTHIDQLSSDHV